MKSDFYRLSERIIFKSVYIFSNTPNRNEFYVSVLISTI